MLRTVEMYLINYQAWLPAAFAKLVQNPTSRKLPKILSNCIRDALIRERFKNGGKSYKCRKRWICLLAKNCEKNGFSFPPTNVE